MRGKWIGLLAVWLAGVVVLTACSSLSEALPFGESAQAQEEEQPQQVSQPRDLDRRHADSLHHGLRGRGTAGHARFLAQGRDEIQPVGWR